MTNLQRYEAKGLVKTRKDRAIWKRENPLRGIKYDAVAREFVKDYPPGAALESEQFDEWLQNHGVLNIPPSDASKDSDAWMAHRRRRDIIRRNLNKAGSHSRMANGSTAFYIATAKGRFIVYDPYVAVGQTDISKAVDSLITKKMTWLKYLLQGANWMALPKDERRQAEALCVQINTFANVMDATREGLDAQFTLFQQHIEQLIENGSITQQLLAAPSEESEAENSLPGYEEYC